MSAPHQKLPASNITCRYWATSGTCFFGDQCNFAHITAERATSGRAVPKREKACKELLLTGYCKNENDGCEYNHSIPGVTRSRPPTPTTSGPSTSALASTWSGTTTRPITSTASAAVIRSKGLPVTAPAFVPAAVAAAQRACLTAWGGLSPGGGGVLATAAQPPSVFTSTNVSLLSSASENGIPNPVPSNSSSTSAALGIVSRTLDSDAAVSSEGLPNSTFLSSTLPASLNAQPFVPSNLITSTLINGVSSATATHSVGSANTAPYVPTAVASAIGAPPFIPKAKQNVPGSVVGAGRHLSDQQQIGIGGSSQHLQLRQQLPQLHLQQHQAAQMLAVAARGMGGNTLSSPYVNVDVPMVMPPFRLPDGDDPALGMTAMSPPNPAFVFPLTRVSNGTVPVLPAPEALASMGIVGDGTGNLPVGIGLPSQLSYGSNVQSQPSVRSQQLQQQMQKLHTQVPQSVVKATGQSHPFTSRSSHILDTSKQQYDGVDTTEMQLLTLGSDLGTGNDMRTNSSGAKSLFVGDSKIQDHGSLSADLDTKPPPSDSSGQHQQSKKQAQPTQKLLVPPVQLLQSSKQRQQQQQILQHQQHMQHMQPRSQTPSPRPMITSVQHQSRLSYRSSGSNLAALTSSAQGGTNYFHNQGQSVSGLAQVPHNGAFMGSTGRGEGRLRAQSSFGHVPIGQRHMSEQLREEFRRRHALTYAQLDTDQSGVNMPETVQGFHTLYPLEDLERDDDSASVALGVRSMVFKGISSSDGVAYAIRRIDSRQVVPNAELATSAAEVVERWGSLSRHPHVVALRDVFISREIEGSKALHFVHDYYPGSVTLEALHLHTEQAANGAPLMPSEDLLWSYLVQLASALRAIHSAGLHLRLGGLHPSKVILPARGRLRVSSAGLLDCLNGNSTEDPRRLQKDDLVSLGRLVLTLACGSTVNPSLEFMAAHYSADLVHVTSALLASPLEKSDTVGINNVRQLSHVLSERVFSEVESVHFQHDELMSELSKETENGRLLRLVVKLGLISDRREGDGEASWLEPGDRSLLKLFRDFVFHQTSDEGKPLIDWNHVIESLNKLDAGVPEKMILFSRDERSMLFASYGDVKRSLESAYQALVNRGSAVKGRSVVLGLQSPLLLSTKLKQRQAT